MLSEVQRGDEVKNFDLGRIRTKRTLKCSNEQSKL